MGANIEIDYKFAAILKPFLQTFITTLLSLLLPLSFLLLARISNGQHLLSFSPHPTPSSIIISLFLHTNPPLIHSLVSFISVIALLQALTGRTLRPHLHIAWTFLCIVQLCVGVGMEVTIAAGVWPVQVDNFKVAWVPRTLFFLGLYETMLVWSRAIVRPVVDDTIYGDMKDERIADSVAMGAAFGTLWWWTLRNEIEVMGVMVQVKKELLTGVEGIDFVCLIIYYMTVAIGALKFAKGLVWLAKLLFCDKNQKTAGYCCEEIDMV